MSVDRSVFPDRHAEPKSGDHLEMIDKPELPSFKIVDVQRDGQSRIVLKLVHLGGQA